VDDIVFAEELGELIDGGEDGFLEEELVVAVVILLAAHRLAVGFEFFGGDVFEGANAA
jgi:hypothetical protein